MKPEPFAEDLSALESADLVDRATSITEKIAELGSEITADSVAEMERLGDEYDALNKELLKREDAEAKLAERAAAAQTRIVGEETEDAEAEAAPEPEAEAGAEPEVLVPELVAASIEKPRAAALTTRLSASQPNALQTSFSAGGDVLEAELQATSLVDRKIAKEGEAMSLGALAEAIVNKRLRFGNVPDGTHNDRLTMATATMPFRESGKWATGDAMENFGTFKALRTETTTLVASGGSCAPLAPKYDIFRLAIPHSPVENALPVLGAPRGGIRFVVPPDFTEARAGVGVFGEACPPDCGTPGSGDTIDKPCIHLDCPDVDECCLTAVSSCIEFGNLQFQVFPEWTASRIEDLAVNFASVKEVFYLDAIDAGSTATTSALAYGAARSMFADISRAAVAYRKRNGMDDMAILDWYVPDWALTLVAVDTMQDHSMGVQVMLGMIDATVANIVSQMARVNGVNIIQYYDTATGLGQAFSGAQAAGVLNAWPTTIISYLHAPGTFVRLDGGTLDVGLVRDSELNRTNDLQLFSEQWISTCKLGIESIKITHTDVCPNGGAPEPATLFAC